MKVRCLASFLQAFGRIGTDLRNSCKTVYKKSEIVEIVQVQLFITKKTVPTKFLKMTRIFDTLVSLSLAIFNDFLTKPFFFFKCWSTHIYPILGQQWWHFLSIGDVMHGIEFEMCLKMLKQTVRKIEINITLQNIHLY